MSARLALACAALLALALGAGWWAAWMIDTGGPGAAAPPPPLTDPAADAAEALPPQPSPPAAPGSATPTNPPGTVADPVTIPPPGSLPAEPPTPPTTAEAPTTAARPTPAPAPVEPAPEPQPTTARRPTTASPIPRPAPEPAPPAWTTPRVVSTSSPPADTRRIAPDQAFTGSDAARRALVAARLRAEPGSPTARAVARQLELWRRYLSPDAGAVPEGRRATVSRALRANAWWYSRWPHPAGQVLLRDQDGVILTHRAGQGFTSNPVATTGRWRDLNLDLSVVDLAEVMLPMGVEVSTGGTRMLVWEYYDIVGDPDAIRPGISGMAQGRLALVMANAHRETGDARFADAAGRALAALAVPVDRGGARSMVSMASTQAPAPWYVERANPGADPWTGAALNGFMVTLLNLRGTSAAMLAAGGEDDPTGVGAEARRLADEGAGTLARHLRDHDTGAWTYYGMLSGGRPWRTYLADLNYHCYHVLLLERLAPLYPGRPFAATAARWLGYVDDAGLTCPKRG